MAIPQVAIVGRPNVGKSSLFNWLAGRRIAIVDPTPGVTRDRLATLIPLTLPSPRRASCQLAKRGSGQAARRGNHAVKTGQAGSLPYEGGDRYFELVDTGGMGVQDVDNLTDHVEKQIQFAIDQAHLILFVVDVRSGLVPLDEEVALRLRSSGKPVLLLANKCDTRELEPQAADFYRFGLEKILCVSAHQNRGKDQLLNLIRKHLPAEGLGEGQAEPALKVAIVGRRNTGKSTFINCLAGGERTIVSEVAGTTRDSVDIHFEKDGRTIIAIDTAGVRYKGHIKSDIDFYSLARAERSIRRADVVLHFFDAPKKISMVDKQLAGYILEQYKPAIFVINKWDLARPLATGTFADYLRKVFPSLDFVPLAFTTAKTGRNVQAVLDLAQNLHKQAGSRVSTAQLNRVVQSAVAGQSPPTRQNRQAKIFFATQVALHPPTLVLVTNGPELFDNTYQRYLMKMFRDHLPFKDVPIKMYLRERKREDRNLLEERPTRPKPKKKRSRTKKATKKTGELWQEI